MKNILLEQELDELQEDRQGFKVEDLEGATWAFRKLRAIESKKTEIVGVAGMERARIDIWEKQQCDQLDRDKEFFESILGEYYKTEKAKDKKFKLSTPYGKVSIRKSSKWIYEDEEALKQYVKDNGIDAIRTKEELDKANLKKICKDGVNIVTGEVLPFTSIEEVEIITVKAE